MKKKQFEPCKMEVKAFADVITTSTEYSGTNGYYDEKGYWVTLEGDGQA